MSVAKCAYLDGVHVPADEAEAGLAQGRYAVFCHTCARCGRDALSTLRDEPAIRYCNRCGSGSPSAAPPPAPTPGECRACGCEVSEGDLCPVCARMLS